MMILDDLKTILKGAVGSLTFGAYHMFLTTHTIDKNNKNIQSKIDENNKHIQARIEKNNRNTQTRFDEIFKRIERLENFNQ